jgi:NAD(P)-dependent dehydrogenase (short-subunit alcohol dehydrogenase family)
VSSGGHILADVDADWNFESRPYDPWKSYGQSKTANILFALALDARGAKFGVRAFALHPGVILATDLNRWDTPEQLKARYTERGYIDKEGNIRFDPLRQIKTVEQGAATTVWAATAAKLDGKGGLYLENINIAPKRRDLTDIDPGSRQ